LTVPFLRQALIAGLLLAVLLAYLGVHVVRRRIVFVDLAVAQLSAVGVALAMLFDLSPLAVSLVVALVGAALLSLPAGEHRLPQEAVMGSVYAVASAVGVLLIAALPHGEEVVANLFFGNLLAVTPGQIGLLTFLFGVVALFHWRAWPHLTAEPAGAPEGGQRLWNLFFYLTLALVIAVAIRTAGVLLVFSDLVIPAVAALLLADAWRGWLVVAVVIGLAGNLTGLYVSVRGDLPTGPAIVAALGGWLVLAAVYRTLKRVLRR
jgi:ABC-type Mn2+/Zn2+ transport system permease subunit